jgi:hypothetical protein
MIEVSDSPQEVQMPDVEALIRERAYLIWEASGKPVGRDKDHWFLAAEEIAAMPVANGAETVVNGAVAPQKTAKPAAVKPAAKKSTAKK